MVGEHDPTISPVPILIFPGPDFFRDIGSSQSERNTAAVLRLELQATAAVTCRFSRSPLHGIDLMRSASGPLITALHQRSAWLDVAGCAAPYVAQMSQATCVLQLFFFF